MKNFLNKNRVVGWTAVAIEPDGLYGVTVLAPKESGGKPCVIKCGFIPGGTINVDSLTALSKLISVDDCPWTLSLGRKAYNILVVPEPTVQPSELEQSIRWSIENMIDYPSAEASLAVMRIPTSQQLPNKQSYLYVAVAKKSLIESYNATFLKAGIDLQAIDVRETAQRNIAALAEKAGKGLGLLSVGKQGVQFIITCNGSLYLDRFIEESLLTNSSNDPDFIAHACERIMQQVQRSLDFVSRTLTFIEIDRVLVAPMRDKVDSFSTITQHLQVPIENLDISSIFDISSIPELSQQENQADYFFSLGAALRFMASSEQINLESIQASSQLSSVKAEMAVLGVVALTLLGVWGIKQRDVSTERSIEAISAMQLREAKTLLHNSVKRSDKDIETEIAALKSQADAAQKILAMTVSLGSPQGYAQHFSLLASLSSEGVWLNSITIDKGGKSVRLSGRTMQKESVLRYSHRLNDTFGPYGVQFTSLELTSEFVAKQRERKPQLAAVNFTLY
jgi:MSHA biogenesis protein MshI